VARPSFISPILFLTLAPALAAQASANWDGVRQLIAGQGVRVILTDGRTLRGKFQSATDDALMVATAKSQEALSRTMVTQVSTRGKSHRLRNALIGFGAGAGGGLIVGAIADADSCHPDRLLGCIGGPNVLKKVFTPLGALVGGIVGAVLPTGGWRDVYQD
jgi:hypothetical protein